MVEIAERLSEPKRHATKSDMETVSYNLPVDLVSLLRELARYRAIAVRAEREAARRAGRTLPPGEARISASKIVLAALEQHRQEWERELAELKAAQSEL